MKKRRYKVRTWKSLLAVIIITLTSQNSLSQFKIHSTTNGEIMIVENTGNVGILTSAPTANLHVQGTFRLTGGLYDGTNALGTSGQILQTTGSMVQWVDAVPAGDTDWVEAGGNVYRENGNVGIGLIDPDHKLTVIGDSRFGGIAFFDKECYNGPIISDFPAIFSGRDCGYEGPLAPGNLNIQSGSTGGIQFRTTDALGNPNETHMTISGGTVSLSNETDFHAYTLEALGHGPVTIGRPQSTSPLFIVRNDRGVPSISFRGSYNACMQDQDYASLDFYDIHTFPGDVGPRSLAKMRVIAKENHGANNHGTSIAFMTRETNGGDLEHVLWLDADGNVGVGTTTPQGKLDVNGSIYQRGSQLHADYVFQDEYDLETIEEHAEFMWTKKHLPAVPARQIDAEGREVIEVGSHQRGILEELEKSHIYIEELHTRLKSTEKIISELQKQVAALVQH
jgi:hypothetical protein